MFKFFRKYNKYLLVVGVTLLMIVFLIEGAISGIMQGGRDGSGEPIGTVAGRTLTFADQREAAIDIQILQTIAPMFVQLGAPDHDDALQWLLILHDAERIGLSASDFEAELLLQAIGLDDPAQLAELTRAANVPADRVREALRHWSIVQQYKELVAGLGHRTVEERIQLYAQAMQTMQIGPMLLAAQGRGRVSEPLLRRFVQDEGARAKVTAAVVPADRYLEQVPEPDGAALRELFERHKDELPAPTGERAELLGTGGGEGYGLGYRLPDRVRLEYLAIPLERVASRVEVTEAEALSYYDENRERYRNTPAPGATQPATQPAYRPFTEVRSQIRAELRQRKAAELADRMIRAAYAMLHQEARALPEFDGYRNTEGFRPTPLETVAQRLQEQFGVLPDVRRIDDRWLGEDALAQLEGIGQSFLMMEGRSPVTFSQYALSARELSPDPEGPLASLRLQALVPSQPLVDMMSDSPSRYLFRIIEARPSEAPQSLEEVRAQVAADARRLAAYRLLLEERPQWLERLRAEGPEALAEAENLRLIEPPPFSRRDAMGGDRVPHIEGVGRSDAFVDAVFALAEEVADAGGVEGVSPAQRSAAIPVDRRMSLYLTRLDELDLPPRSQLEQYVRLPGLPAMVHQGLLDEEGQLLSADAFSRGISLEALKRRTGFVAAGEAEAETAPAEAAAVR